MKKIFISMLFLINSILAQNAWINEFHYDNAGADTDMFVEIAIENSGSFNLSNFTLSLYNGGNGTTYSTETVNNFTVGSSENNITLYYWDGIADIQNGPDGFSLDYNGTVIQFLSYEGSFTATSGAAIGLTSTDIGVSEPSSPIGETLQLIGFGTNYDDFTWSTPIAGTKGTFNNGQGFIEAPNAWINEFHYDNAGADLDTFVEIAIENSNSLTLANLSLTLYNGGVGNEYNSESVDNFTVGSSENNVTIYYWDTAGDIQNGPDGFSLDYNGAVLQFISYEGSFVATDGPANGLTSTDIGVSEPSPPAGETLQLVGFGSEYNDFTWSTPMVGTKGLVNNRQAFIDQPNAWINEFHYDNAGADTDTFVEIALENANSYTLSNFSVNLYNGSNGTSYGSESLNNFIQSSVLGGITIYYWEPPTDIQNGPDGFSLEYNGAVFQFISYEGSFTATDGPAIGSTSVDIGVSEVSSPVGETLQLIGMGTKYTDFTWSSPISGTKGLINNGQSFNFVTVQLEVFLEGPYNTILDEMSDGLSTSIPLTSPFTEDLKSVSTIPANIVDWVLVELRNNASGPSVSSVSAFLDKDGKIVADDGVDNNIYLSAQPGEYYVVVKHRNHLPIMSNSKINLTTN